MTTITFNPRKHFYLKDEKKFKMSEKDVSFDTSYVITNSKTGGKMQFDFSHSTGSEFDPKTCWIYKSNEGYTLEVCNDEAITAERERAYLNSKLRKG
jgi:hypothetical protein